MKKILLLSITSLAMLMADFTLIGEQLTPVTEPVAETTPTATEPTAPTITTGEYTIVPGLYGLGTDTRAAYGGAVDPVILHVDTLAAGISNTDSTHGSFEWAVTQAYPRIIVFDVSGVINGKSTSLQITNPYIMIAGQTAPDHIVYKGAGLNILTHDVVIHHFTIRNGDYPLYDSISVVSEYGEVYNVVVDHCSMSLAGDELFSVAKTKYSCHNITLSNSILAEAIDATHAYGSLNYAQDVSHIGNLYAHLRMRGPQLGYTSKLAVYNTVIYNWIHSSVLLGGYGTEELTYIGNVQIAGPNNTTNYAPSMQLVQIGSSQKGHSSTIYMDDNIKWDGTTPKYDVFDNAGDGYTIPDSPISIPNYVVKSSSSTRANVLANAGARPGARDATDARLVNEVTIGTGAIVSKYPVTYPKYTETTSAFVPVANPHDMYNEHYTNLENQLHQLAEAVETSK